MDEQLDKIIDEVAREMTDVEPSASRRASVLDAIERESRHAAPSVPRWAWAGAAAVVALALATAIWMTRQVPKPGDAGMTVAEHSAQAPARSVAAPPAVAPGAERGAVVAAATAADAGPAGVQAARRHVTHEARLASAAAAREEALVPALAEIAPLAFSQVDPSPLNVRGVEVTPLDIAPLVDIPSLEHGSAEDRSSEPRKEN